MMIGPRDLSPVAFSVSLTDVLFELNDEPVNLPVRNAHFQIYPREAVLHGSLVLHVRAIMPMVGS
ncbi:hypothetical protein DJ82_13960 [Halorubrum sp. Ib24]|nr:hypothetical protein DJ82_13960 [Halorubrum sp. Ib24]OYR53037.1 hypothetical protein DJ74_00115 [Halorubrum sp. Ea8]